MTKGGSLPNIMNPLADINSLIQNGPFIRAQKIIIFGPEAVGKSTLASKFPAPVLFIDTEDGSLRIDTRRVRALDGDTFFSAIRALAKAQELPCRTVIIDTIDAGENFVRERVLRVHQLKSIEGTPYGVGWSLYHQEFSRLLAEFDRLIARGIHVCIVSHAAVRRFQTPAADVAYDRFELNVQQRHADQLKQWCDALLFLDWDVKVIENRSGKARAIGGKTRVLHTQHCAAFDAKSRVNLPERLPCEIDALAPLFGLQQEEVTKEEDPAASASASPERTAPLSSGNPELSELYDRLLSAIADLDKDDVCAYLVSRKLIPEGGSIDDLSENQVKWILEHTTKFREQVEKFAKEPF